MVCVPFQDVHTRLVITSPCRHIRIGLLLGKSFCKVKTESVHIILCKEILKASLDMLPNHRILVVHIVVYIVRMSRAHIEPWIIFCCNISIIPHFCPRMRTCSMVIYNIYNNRQSPPVAFINKFLVVLPCSVIFVQCKPVVRVVSPAQVAVKLLYRHKFHCIHTQFFYVVKTGHGSIYIL